MASAYLFAMLAVTPSKSREVALIANPEFEAGRVAGHRARRLIDGGNPAFSDPFLVMAEDWVPRDAFSRHPHRGIETVTLVLDDALGSRDATLDEHLVQRQALHVDVAGDLALLHIETLAFVGLADRADPRIAIDAASCGGGRCAPGGRTLGTPFAATRSIFAPIVFR